MTQNKEFSIKTSYTNFLEGLTKETPVRSPVGLISAVISRHFGWALDKGVSFEELFHEGVVAFWTAVQDNELPLQEQSTNFYWTAVRWFLLGYCRSLFKEQAMPMSQLASSDDEEYEYWLIQNVLRSPEALAHLGSLNDLIDRIMKVVREKGIQGSSSRKLRGNTEQKIRDILYHLAAGYNGLEIAQMMGYSSESSVNRAIAAVARKLREDGNFQELYAEHIPAERPARRSGGPFRGKGQPHS